MVRRKDASNMALDENGHVCVWIDNCYINGYGKHLTIQDQSQNSTALCVAEIPCRLPYFRGQATIDVVIGSIGSVAAALVRVKRSFCEIVGDLGLFADRPSPIPSIRAPLHPVQNPVQNPGWRPLLLTTQQVPSYKGLIELLDYIASPSNHTHLILPILFDENIHRKVYSVFSTVFLLLLLLVVAVGCPAAGFG